MVALKGFLQYKSLNYDVSYDEKEEIILKGMLVTFSNSKQYGNNIIISPHSSINDGYVRLITVKKFPIIYLPVFGYYLLSKQIHKFKFTQEIKSKSITLINPNQEIHIDGEPVIMTNKLDVEVIPKSLKIIVP